MSNTSVQSSITKPEIAIGQTGNNINGLTVPRANLGHLVNQISGKCKGLFIKKKIDLKSVKTCEKLQIYVQNALIFPVLKIQRFQILSGILN